MELDKRKEIACQLCDRTFAVKSPLVQHEANHSDIRSFKCNICPEGRFCKTKYQLSHHKAFHY